MAVGCHGYVCHLVLLLPGDDRILVFSYCSLSLYLYLSLSIYLSISLSFFLCFLPIYSYTPPSESPPSPSPSPSSPSSLLHLLLLLLLLLLSSPLLLLLLLLLIIIIIITNVLIVMFQIFGMIAIVSSMTSYIDHRVGDYAGAGRKRKYALGFGITAIILGSLALLTVLIMIPVMLYINQTAVSEALSSRLFNFICFSWICFNISSFYPNDCFTIQTNYDITLLFAFLLLKHIPAMSMEHFIVMCPIDCSILNPFGAAVDCS